MQTVESGIAPSSVAPRRAGARGPRAIGSRDAIPDKLYFRIGEVAALAGVPAYVLRYWQSEFPQLQPKRSGSGQRLYRRRDVELVLRVRDLLYRERFTVAGAKRALGREERGGPKTEDLLEALGRMRESLEAVAGLLGSRAGTRQAAEKGKP